MRRPVDKLLEDITLAADVAQEIVDRGRDHFEADPITQFGAEAVVGRIGDAASKLPEDVRASMPGLPGRRSSVSASSWTTCTTGWTTAASGNTLAQDIPRLRAAIDQYRRQGPHLE